MQSIFMIAKRMRNTTGSGRWMDTNGEATTWGVLIVFVFVYLYFPNPSSLVAQRLKCLPAMWETRVRSLGLEDPLGRKWQPTPVFLPGLSHGQRSLVGYSPQGRKEWDTTEQLHFHFHMIKRTLRM